MYIIKDGKFYIEELKEISQEDILKELNKTFIEKPKLELEKENFKVDSSNWGTKKIDGEKIKINPEGDITEFIKGEYKGEQLFTWDAAMRETKKAGKRIPTDEEFNLFGKEDFPQVLPGYRNTNGSYYLRESYGFWWSSTQSDSSNAWNRGLDSGYSEVSRGTSSKTNGVSVVCLKD